MSTLVTDDARRTGSSSRTSVRNGSPANPSLAVANSPLAQTAAPGAGEPSARREQLLRDVHWTRADGSVCFAPAESRGEADRRRAALHAAIRDFGDDGLVKIAKAAASRIGKPATELKGVPKPEPSFQSELLQSTVLRTDWSARATQLALDWSRPAIQLELSVGREILASGSVAPHVLVDGQMRAPVGPWEEVCWVADEEGDYLELEIALAGGVRLQRQFVLLRRDGLLWMADVVLNSTAADLHCECVLPLSPTAKFSAADETQEVRAMLGKRPLTILPTALPEWRVERRGGELTTEGNVVRLQRSAPQATALYAPLCLVVDPLRAKRDCTWRRLTIGEDLQIQANDRAVGYRVQLGREHWLVYRSFTPRANRTVLGVNLQTNFMFARFGTDGKHESLIEIED